MPSVRIRLACSCLTVQRGFRTDAACCIKSSMLLRCCLRRALKVLALCKSSGKSTSQRPAVTQ